MIKGIESVTIFSAEPKALTNFYEEKVGLPKAKEYEMGENEESVFGFEFENGALLHVMKNPQGNGDDGNQRIQVSFEVENVEEAFAKVKGNGVKVVQETYHIEGYGYLATFEDLDGNHFQLAQVREG